MSSVLQVTPNAEEHYVWCQFGQSRLGGDATDDVTWNRVYQSAREHWARCVILDFSQVRLMTSAALGKLLLLNKKLATQGRQLCVCGLSQQLRDILEVTHLHRVLRIADGIDSCLSQTNPT